ncbi:VOC family protein [Microbacterium sp. SLBN-154]|uniref:VOC family protein n=1 Tax=Microbacterium sp. SLBN-154 TaxID=2768458 RepID=UPI001356CA4F
MASVFGYPHMGWEDPLRQQLLDSGLTTDDLEKRGLAEDPEGVGPRLFFHHADGPKRGRNRLHLDVTATRDPGDEAALDAEKDRLVALGATVVRLVEQSGVHGRSAITSCRIRRGTSSACSDGRARGQVLGGDRSSST